MMKNIVESIEMGLESKHPNLKKFTTTILDSLNTMVLPLAMMNAGRKKVEAYFEKQFKKEFEEKTASIPPEHQQEPKQNIVRQAVIGIADTIDQPTLKKAYLNMLAKSFDDRNDDSLYPAYLNIIQQLGSQGLACFVNFFIKYQQTDKHYPPVYSSQTGAVNFSHLAIQSDLLPIPKKAMLENWVRLGLITMSPKLEKKPIVSQGWTTAKIAEINEPPHQSLTLSELRLTDFALEFIDVVED